MKLNSCSPPSILGSVFRVLRSAFCLVPSAFFLLPSAPAQEWLDNERRFKSDDPNYHYRRSEHFRIMWGQGMAEDKNANSDFGQVTEQLAQGNLQMLERVWHCFHDPAPKGLGFNPDGVGQSANRATWDGKRYRVNLMMNNTGIWAGGAWGSVDDWGLPLFALPPSYLSYDPPSGATPHEYGHTALISAAGFNDTPYDGMWHEATANWVQLQFLNSYPGPGGVGVQPFLSVPHGRNYYDSWQLWEHFRETPEYGTAFIGKLWTEARGSRSKGAEYIFDAMVRLDPSGSPDSYNGIKDAIGRMSARNVMWDYQRQPFFQRASARTMDPFTEMYRRAYTELERRQGDTRWFRVPFAHAPMQCGYNVVPIALHGKTGPGYSVSVELRPLWDPTRRSDWRATLVAVNDRGESRYSTLWNTGVNSISLAADENQLFLCVAATPDFMGYEGFSRPLISDLPLQPQSYEVAFVNTQARAYESRPTRPAGVSGQPHPNGGGFVAASAKAEPTAYVGPDAMVLGHAQVLGRARVEDFAVVLDRAVVQDQACLSGHALVKDNAQVRDQGRVRDWATVGGAWIVSGHGRALERAFLLDRGELSEDATIKGNVPDYGGARVRGHAIKDGDCANSASVDKQVLMCWVWGIDQKYADERPDTGGLYCNFQFTRHSPIYALDRYGVLHGYLQGGPRSKALAETSLGLLELNGRNQYVELKRDIADFVDTTFAVWVNWSGGSAGQRILHLGGGADRYLYLTPSDPKTGNLKFAIRSGPEAEQSLEGPEALPVNRWTHLAVTLKGDSGTLFMDGREVASNPRMTLNPDQVLGPNTLAGADSMYLGRGPERGFFKGMLTDFRVYVRPQPATVISEAASLIQDRQAIPSPEPSDSEPPTVAKAGFLMPPTLLGADALAMSAPKAKDASEWVEYEFVCTRGGGKGSGWISANRFTACDLAPGRTYEYAFRLRDKAGNQTPLSPPAQALVPNHNPALAAVFEQSPVGISTSAIRMVAHPAARTSGLVEYEFSRDDGASSGWQSSRTWVDTGLIENSRHTYTVRARYLGGKPGNNSEPLAAVARDDTPPARYPVGEWQTLPTATLSNSLIMKAMSVTGENGCPKIEPDPVEYLFECTSSNGPNSGWISRPQWETPPLPDGRYTYAFKIRDTSPAKNQTPFSSAETATVSPLSGYHPFPLTTVLNQPEGTLVSFQGKVIEVGEKTYTLSDGAATATVSSRGSGRKTDASLLNRDVTVQGCVWKVGGEKQVTWAELK